jgi:thymidylate kinase
VIIEFAGLPGSGKSTAAAHLITLAHAYGLDTRTAADLRQVRSSRAPTWVRKLLRPATDLLSILTHPKLSWTIFAALNSSKRSRAEKLYAFRHVLVTIRALRAANRDNGASTLTVFHEGLCQRAFLSFVDGEGAAGTEATRRFVRSAPKPDVVVVLQVPPDLALTRVAGRGHGALSYRFEQLSREELLERLAEGQRLLLNVARQLASMQPSARTFVVDARDLTESIDRLECDVLPHLLTELAERDIATRGPRSLRAR